jgi:uncharacterized protein (DUF427 family)
LPKRRAEGCVVEKRRAEGCVVEAVCNGQVIARSGRTLLVDGYPYFPPEDVRTQLLRPSRTKSLCPWKGIASYLTVDVAGRRHRNAAWTYRHPFLRARRIANRIAFGDDVSIGTAE